MNSYTSSLLKQNDLEKKHSYRKQAEQSARARKITRPHMESTPQISPHSEDCAIGEAEKDILLGKMLEDRAKEISNIAQEICDIQEEWHEQNSRVNDKEQHKCHPNLNEIEDRERELKNIEEEIINILKNRDEERSLKKLKKKDNTSNMKGQRQLMSNKIDEDNDCNDNEAIDETNDVENEISFIESLVEEDILGINQTFDELLGSMEENEDTNLASLSEHELETKYVEMQRLLEEIENEFE